MTTLQNNSFDDSPHTWETLKENAAPLQRGRNVSTLTKSLQAPMIDRDAFDKQKKKYERLVRPSEKKSEEIDGDPIIHWLSYIKFIQDTLPSDTQSSFLLLERCTRALLNDSRYQNDVRFIRVCILYADKTSEPSAIFKFLHQKKVGSQTALFWVAWAWVAEKAGDFSFADKIFLKGKEKGAKPKKLVDERHLHFQRRMSRHWLNKNENEENDECAAEREGLAPLTRDGLRINDRSRSANVEYAVDENTGRRVPMRPVNRSTRGTGSSSSSRRSNRSTSTKSGNGNNNARAQGFSIFTEDAVEEESEFNRLDQSFVGGADEQRRQRRKLAKEAERKKENIMKAERWNERGGISSQNNRESHHEQPQLFHARSLPQAAPTNPTFEVFVDDECAKENSDDCSNGQERHQNHERSKPTSLRQRLDAGVMDKLTRDPLRYIKNPQKIVVDQEKDTIVKKENNKSLKKELPKDENSRSKKTQTKNNNNRDKSSQASSQQITFQAGFNKKLLSKDSYGQESCFEEARALAKYFTLISSSDNFNMLQEDNSIINNSSANMMVEEMSDSDMVEDESVSDKLKIEDINLNVSTNSVTWNHPNENNESNVSSVLEENNAVGVIEEKNNDPTINTKFAMRELSMMFADESNVSSVIEESNAVGVMEEKNNEATVNTKFAMRELSMMFASPGASNQSRIEEVDEKASKPFVIFQEDENPGFTIMDENDCDANDNSILAAPGVPKHFATKKVTFSSNDENQPINQAQGKEIQRNKRKALGQVIALSPLRSESAEESDPKGDDCHSNPTAFEIFCDEENTINSQDNILTNNMSKSTKEPFSIFVDETESTLEMKKEVPKIAMKPKVLTMREEEARKPEGEDTATFSMIGEILNNFDGGKKETKGIEERNPSSSKISIFEDTNTSNGKTDVLNEAHGTTGFAIFEEHSKNEMAHHLDSSETDDSRFLSGSKSRGFIGEQHEKRKQDSKRGKGFAIFSDVENGADDDVSVASPEKSFGDISNIEPVEEADQVTLMESLEKREDGVDYRDLHNEDMVWALDRAMEEAAKHIAFDANVSTDTFEWSGMKPEGGHVGDRRRKGLPKALLKKKTPKGTKVELAGSTAEVKHELGRGAYGVVLLCKTRSSSIDSSGSSDELHNFALKIQAPTDCLAWEYHILNKLEERLPQKWSNHNLRKASTRSGRRRSKDESEGTPFPFPRPTYFAAYNDGAILGMTAGSTSGMTLVDVVNAYRVAGGGPVPELLALHYTARMLMHIECLHWHGKILHCDVKPDNWVLTASKAACGIEDGDIIEGSDLMLIDFGRALDLTTATRDNQDPLKIRFLGDIAADDMACVAMRENRCWGADVDTFGICASALALLYGSYMDVKKDPVSGRWTPQKPLRRYWNKNLWNNLFDTLLNPDGMGTSNIPSSHPNNLRALRKSIENYLGDGSRQYEVASLLRHQAGLLPNIRKN